jgi:hypothetical protein
MSADETGSRTGDDDHPAILPWYVSGRLDHAAMEKVRHHVSECDSCRREVEALAEMREAMRQPGGTDHVPPADLVAFEEGAIAADPLRAAAIVEHLEGCPGCTEEVRALRQSLGWRDVESSGPKPETTPPAARAAAAPFTHTIWKWAFFATAASFVLFITWPARHTPPPSLVVVPTRVESITLKRPVRGANGTSTLSGPGPWVITLLLPFGSTGRDYDVTIARDGAALPSPPLRLRAGTEGTTSFLLPLLPEEGRYVVLLTPSGGAGDEPIEYPFVHTKEADDGKPAAQ